MFRCNLLQKRFDLLKLFNLKRFPYGAQLFEY